MKLRREHIFYALAVLVIIFMHTALLASIPRGLNVDEVGTAYDAYALGKFGVDRWMTSWPVYFKNYGDGQNALYTYLLVPIFLIAGTSIYAVRSVIAISALVMAIAGAKTVKLITDNKKAEIVFLFLFAVMPVFTITLRFGLESHLMMSTSSVAIYFLIKAIQTGKRSSYLALGISAGVILYTYALAYMMIPLFLAFSLIYLILKKEIKFINFILTSIPFAIMALPLFIEQMINKYDLPEKKLGIFTFTKLNGYRISELMTTDFFTKILRGIKSTFLFDDLRYNSVPKFGNFYYISVPFILIGIVYCCYRFIISLKKNEKLSLYSFPLLFWISCTLISGFMSNMPGYINLTRMNGVLASLILFIFIGIDVCIQAIKKEKIRKGFTVLVSAGYGVLFLLFAIYYFTSFDEDAYPYKWLFYEPYDEEIFEYLDDPANGFTENDVHLPWNYMYYLWTAKADPMEIQMVQSEEGDRDIKEFGRYKMTEGVNFNQEYVIYKYGFTEDTIAYFRNLHFTEYETDHFIIFLDPLHGYTFFGENVLLGNTEDGDVILSNAYLSDIGNGQVALYGWVDLPDDFGDAVSVLLQTEEDTFNMEILADTYDNGRTVCFQIILDYESFYNYKTKIFCIRGYDSDASSPAHSIEYDMLTK